MTSKEKMKKTSEEKRTPEQEKKQASESDFEEVAEAAEAQGDEKEIPEAAESEEDSMTVKYMRLLADFQNFKKRTAKERDDICQYANENIMTELLQVLDNFERALEHDCLDDKYRDGMEMIFRQLTDVLQKAGLKEIEALGEDFDPNFHNAVMTEDNPDYESGKVSDVMQKGYTLNNKVIRPSMVKVNN